MTTDSVKTNTLRVPGASLYYEVRGSGPVLLMIAAGAGDASVYSALYDVLTPQFTVVTYDRRGYTRSPLDHPDQLFEMDTYGDDAAAILKAVTSEPANVFGCSIGAMIALNLTTRCPNQVGTLVAHEPPIKQIMMAEGFPNLGQLNREQGQEAALKQFMAAIGIAREGKAINVDAQTAERAAHNRDAWFKYDVPAVAHYDVDIEKLKTVPTKVVVAGGRDGKAFMPYKCAVMLARELGTTVEEFPGTHAGFVDYPVEYAERLVEVLSK